VGYVTRRRLLAVLCLAPLLGGADAANLASALADPSIGSLRSQAQNQRARERSLSSSIDQLGQTISRLERQLATLRSREAEVQADLDRDQAKLDRVQNALRAQRTRLARLRARLAEARRVLAQRLVELYKTPQPELVTIVMDSHSFADLLEAAAFIKRVQNQDTRIVNRVKSARRDATVAVARLSRDERRQRGLVAIVQARRNALASMTAATSTRQATLVRTRAVRAAALTATRSNRHRVEARIAKLEAAARAASVSSPGPGGPWAIPWPIVQCESGGQNLPPNSAGASGYYQILPETWRLYGGKGPAAWKAPKAEQDRVAARIWDHGRGRNAWVCAGLVD
jgi:septal ring factor EnvC (AmiA/AmiB activator)